MPIIAAGSIQESLTTFIAHWVSGAHQDSRPLFFPRKVRSFWGNRVAIGTRAYSLLVNRLPVHERLVFTLFHLDGRPAGEIAAMTGRPVGTVTKQLSRAMKRLRRWARKQELS